MKIQHLIIVLILLFLTGCNKELRHPIEGNWIGYESGLILGKDTVGENFHFILSIDQDSIIARNFKNKFNGSRDSISSFSYVISDSLLIIGQNTKSPDSLRIEFPYTDQMHLITPKSIDIYARLSEPIIKSNAIKLIGNVFTISDSVQVIDTIEFLDNNSFLIYNLYSGGISQIQEWRLRQYLGYNLLVVDDPELPVFFITKTQNNSYELKRYPTSRTKWTLKELKKYDRLKQFQLNGKWNGKGNIPNFDIQFEFYSDSVKMNDITGEEILKTDYILNLNRDMIFIYNSINYSLMSYRINDIKQDSIFLTRMSPVKDSFILTRMN